MGQKGGGFEREVSRALTKWWAGDDSDDLFWRTSNSGGRSTVRRRKGKRSSGHDADIGATSPAGAPLCRLIAFEVKRGYNHVTLHTLLDRDPARRQPRDRTKRVVLPLEAWVGQADEARERAGAYFWAIIHRRDNCKPVVYFPHKLMTALMKEGAFPRPVTPFATYGGHVRTGPDVGRLAACEMCVTSLYQFFKNVKPAHIHAVLKRLDAVLPGKTPAGRSQGETGKGRAAKARPRVRLRP